MKLMFDIVNLDALAHEPLLYFPVEIIAGRSNKVLTSGERSNLTAEASASKSDITDVSKGRPACMAWRLCRALLVHALPRFRTV